MVVKNVELPEYSVLMSVYAGEKPEHLRASIESMLSQTYVTNDFVLVLPVFSAAPVKCPAISASASPAPYT